MSERELEASTSNRKGCDKPSNPVIETNWRSSPSGVSNVTGKRVSVAMIDLRFDCWRPKPDQRRRGLVDLSGGLACNLHLDLAAPLAQQHA